MNWIDSVIEYFAPVWAAERRAYRVALSEGYRSADHTRIGADNAVGGRADYHLDVTGDRREIVERARQLERNNVVACGLLDRAVENVVGTGFSLKPMSGSKMFDTRVKELWDEWTTHDCDARDILTFNDILGLAYRSWLRDGDVAFILLSDGRIQGIESDQITNPGGTSIPQNGWVDGVKLDRVGRPLAYNIVPNPDPIWVNVQTQPAQEIPAKWVKFLARHQRLGQTRGISAFAGNAWLLENLEKSVEATVVAQRMAACVGLWIRRQTRLRGLSTETTNAGVVRRKLSMEPASIMELLPEEEIGQINPAQPSTNFKEFTSLLGRLCGIPFGLPLEIAFGDYSQVNYSSARSSLLQAQKTFKRHQHMLAKFASEIYQWKVANWIREGKLRATPGAMKHKFVLPGWAWVDPVKEVQADLMAVDAGFKTRTQVVEERGGQFADNLIVLGEEIEAMEEADIPVVASSNTRIAEPPEPPAAAPGAQPTPDDTEEPDDGE